MAWNRRRDGGRNIRGPQSALTDFLASNNISAAEIRHSYDQRLRNAQDSAQQSSIAEDVNVVNPTLEASSKKRKREEAKYKQRKNVASDDDFGDMRFPKARLIPGQFDHCEICAKRFTVTAYSKNGPRGGLLCNTCSKSEMSGDKKARQNKTVRKGRRQNVSKIMDGFVQRGALSLVELCVKMVADNINDIDEFGDLPATLLRRLSQILSKKRAITPRTLELFMRGNSQAIDVYDCAKLEEQDFHKIFVSMPALEALNLRFAGQLKNENMMYLMHHNEKLKHIQLNACNLISDEYWQQYFERRGSQLESVKLSDLDCSLTDEAIIALARDAPNLRRLKLIHCWKLGSRTVSIIGTLLKLQHLSLCFHEPVKPNILRDTIQKIGANLESLSLRSFFDSDDQVLETIHLNCCKLSKFRFSDNYLCTDEGYKRLFTDWKNPPLRFIDLSSTRDIDNTNPDGPNEPIGLASEGFKAMMSHSGKRLEVLNISSCRHISHSAFIDVFNGGGTFPNLREIDISFQPRIDDSLIEAIFSSCQALEKVVAFGCFGIQSAKIPPGVAFIGGLNSHSFLLEDTGMGDTSFP